MTHSMRLLFFLSLPIAVFLAPLDSCTRIDTCSGCTNSTDLFGYRCQWCSTSGKCTSEQSDSDCHVDDMTLDMYNCPRDVSNVRYDELFMRETVLPLIAATHSPDHPKLLRALASCFGDNIKVIGLYEIYCDDTQITTCFGYSAYIKDQNAMVLTFRGTTSLFQLIDEGISFFLHPKIEFNVTEGVVDGYYLNTFYKLWEKGMRNDVEQILEEKGGNVKFWFFGHSLGGGLASIASAYVTKRISWV